MTRGPAAKSLRERVRERTFVARKHEDLLATDDTLAGVELAEDDKRLGYWVPLFELLLWYRHAARDDAERRRAALAFEAAVNGELARWEELMGGVRWTDPTGKGRWKLEPIDEDAERRRFLTELWEGLVDLEKSGASVKAQIEFASSMARKFGYPEKDVHKHIAQVFHGDGR